MLRAMHTMTIINTIRLILGILFAIAVASSFLLFFDNMIDVLRGISWLQGLAGLQDFLNYVYCVTGFVLLVIAVLTGRQIERRIGVALEEFAGLIEAMRAGDYRKTTTLSLDDELGFVIYSLNRLAADLEKANVRRRKMLAGIAHELNTPLTTLRGNLEAVLEGMFSPDEHRLRLLLEETVYLQRLIGDLRELSLAEAGELPLGKVRVKVPAAINHVLAMLEPLLGEKETRVTASYEEDLPDVLADQDRLYQIIYNLVVNALQFGGRPGLVGISARRVSDGRRDLVEIAVSDNGIGISEADLPLIFDQFYRVDESRSRKTGGSGIGLAIVKQLAEAHGGYVRVSSRLGEGSVFHVGLPLFPGGMQQGGGDDGRPAG
ncbi:sensor histidine kinase [Anaeroselena agilis]|uniref:histidine kinase n=1 Tax=Anaeroselena agilis TaxID=3063788 RepID=A0ABU3NSI7_9FIRM|nr:HAMP domain-containing sensor histidine kinase [Selenomonadales bacterium 4137-cl]